MDFDWLDIGRLLCAALAGGIIGFERELHDKPAGFRTNIMICLGAALFTILSQRMAEANDEEDVTRIASNIVTGVGFLGAGAIIQFRGNVIGLTTAATIWTVSSVGMAFGAGRFLLGFVVTALTSGVLFGLSYIEREISQWRTVAYLEIDVDHSPENGSAIKQKVRECGVGVGEWTVTKTHNGLSVQCKIIGPKEKIEQLQGMLIMDPRVTSLRRL